MLGVRQILKTVQSCTYILTIILTMLIYLYVTVIFVTGTNELWGNFLANAKKKKKNLTNKTIK